MDRHCPPAAEKEAAHRHRPPAAEKEAAHRHRPPAAEKEAAHRHRPPATEKAAAHRHRPTAAEKEAAHRHRPTAAEKEAALRSFLVATGQEPEGGAIEFLQRAEWRLEDALKLFGATQGDSTVARHAADPAHAAGPSAGAVRHLPTATEKEAAIRSFLEVATGLEHETAIKFLQRSQWCLEDALQLFYAASYDSHATSSPPLVEGVDAAEVEKALRLPSPPVGNGVADSDDDPVRQEGVVAMKKDYVHNFVMEPIGSEIKRQYILRGDVYNGLKSYQKEGLLWFWELHCSDRGGILADDMGLGKTRQVAAFLSGLFESHLIDRVLVVVPPILTYQWVEELKTVGLQEQTHIFKDPKTRNIELQKVVKNGGLLICSSGLISREWRSLDGFGKWDYVIIDEAHTLNKSGTEKFKSLKKIRCSHRVLVTGTPVQNNLEEMYVLLHFCCPGVLGNLNDFKENFLAPIVDGNFKGSTNEELIESSEAAGKLRAAMKPYMLRRMKKDIALPEKTEFTVWLKLTPYQRKLYTTFLKTNTFYKGDKGAVLVASMLLQKICNHPCKLTKEQFEMELYKHESKLLEEMVQKLERNVPRNDRNDHEFNFSCKIEFILKLLERLYGHHKVLIFAQTREMLDAIEDALLKKEYNFLRIDGTTKPSERKELVEAFKKEGGAEIFLLSTRVGGVGLNLPIASRTIIVDPAWNPRLVATSTIEQYIYETQLFKSGLFKLPTENADFKRYICKEIKDELLRVPDNFSTSRTQRQLMEETMKEKRSENTQKEIDELKKSGFGNVSIHNRLFCKTIQLPGITEGNWREKKVIKSRSGPRYDGDRVVGGEAFSFKPRDGPVVMLPTTLVDEEDESDARARRERRKAFLEEEIKKYTYIKKTFFSTLPDDGERTDITIEGLEKELSELQSDPDGRAKGG